MEKKRDYVSKAGLKARGWTEKGIELFLGKHDKEGINPYYKCAAPTKLFLLERVETAEALAEYKKFQEKCLPRRLAAKEAVKTKTSALLATISNMEIHVKVRERHQLLKAAIWAYNSFKEQMSIERGHDYDNETARENSTTEFLERITVNYVRHNLTSYDRGLELMFGKVGGSEAYYLLNKKIYEKIADTYPHLKNECARQLERKFSEDNENATFGQPGRPHSL